MSRAEELELIRLCRKGEQNACRSLVERYQDSLYNYCFRILKDPSEAEEIAQECFVRTLTRLDRYKESYPFASWLFRIAHNLCIDHIRKRKRIAYSLDAGIEGEEGSWHPEPASRNPSPQEDTIQQETNELLNQAIAELPEQYRSILLLRHQEDLSYQEISSILKLPLGTVKIRIHRARERLKRRLRHESFLD